MLAVVASRLDPAARDLVGDLSSAGAALLSAEDLTSPGWVFRVGEPGAGVAVVEGRRIPVRELRGVVTRRPAVVAEELRWIATEDRQYVAAEVNAFLVAWLSAVPCPVVNRPSGVSLSGPGWRRQHWEAAAARAGIVWDSGEPESEVVVCGPSCIGARTIAESTAARALADAAEVQLLGVRFSSTGAAVSVTEWPSLEGSEVRAALLRALT